MTKKNISPKQGCHFLPRNSWEGISLGRKFLPKSWFGKDSGSSGPKLKE